jgi:hypothetical protein
MNMDQLKKWIPAILGGLFLFFMVVGYITTSNTEITLRNRVSAQQTTCEAYYDKVWKIISQKAQVADKYKETFKDIYPKLMEGRYGGDNGNLLMKWITESNPNFDVSLYKDLSASIEAERTGFFMEQKKLIDINNAHKTYKSVFPASFFFLFSNRPDVEIKVITSSKTQDVYKTGNEDDIKI